jgi:hypothetical protein
VLTLRQPSAHDGAQAKARHANNDEDSYRSATGHGHLKHCCPKAENLRGKWSAEERRG